MFVILSILFRLVGAYEARGGGARAYQGIFSLSMEFLLWSFYGDYIQFWLYGTIYDSTCTQAKTLRIYEKSELNGLLHLYMI
ncbi:hypothetical protein DX130_15440 [Paenibacillus paeoniae]|uniref:Uncharacterized protein n=1 Tax=Paenibacillus paeoniae TaxID=2292705 RepID=A0A371PHM8_9BACL|nr:hypothetical protein DX130_15440 [Paenibacillus paeoniae]